MTCHHKRYWWWHITLDLAIYTYLNIVPITNGTLSLPTLIRYSYVVTFVPGVFQETSRIAPVSSIKYNQVNISYYHINHTWILYPNHFLDHIDINPLLTVWSVVLKGKPPRLQYSQPNKETQPILLSSLLPNLPNRKNNRQKPDSPYQVRVFYNSYPSSKKNPVDYKESIRIKLNTLRAPGLILNSHDGSRTCFFVLQGAQAQRSWTTNAKSPSRILFLTW